MMQRTVISLLRKIRSGSSEAQSRLFELLRPELHRRASKAMARERKGHTLQATALVHEFWYRFLSGKVLTRITGRVHLLRKASQIMERILIEHARTRNALKRGGGRDRVPLGAVIDHRAAPAWDALVVREAIEELGRFHERQATIVVLHYLEGLALGEVARRLGVSLATVENDLRVAKAWLHRRLDPRESHP